MATSTPAPEPESKVTAPVTDRPTPFTKPMALSERMVSPERAAELNQKYELMRSRNWITDRMIEQTQHHLHCSREQALERLIGEPAAS